MNIKVMWLINHTSARKFEVPMLNAIGVKEIFLPKSFPNDPGFRSASIDWSEDKNLSIPGDDLAVLNSADWYGGANALAWKVANKYFDVVFIILYNPSVLENASKYFRGIVLWRTYGLDKSQTYSRVLEFLSHSRGEVWVKHLGKRFVFGESYSHIADIESQLIKNNRIYLPLGLSNTAIDNKWSGFEKKVLFVCPDIGFNPYYASIYKQFIADFKGVPYAIAGAQPICVNDPNVLGFVPYEIHDRNMREMRVMYYHSSEPNHIHYHPFEAIRAGMPLVFMAGGMLDRFGGVNLPGRCKTIKEARKKIELILNDDWNLIEAIRKSQVCLLEPMKPENCEAAWREGFQHILARLKEAKASQSIASMGKIRIAVIVPVFYRGGCLRGAKMLAQAIELGSRQAGQDAEVVLAHLDDPVRYPDEEFLDLPATIKRRPYQWQLLKQDEACRAMAYAGLEQPMVSATYQVPDDGIKQFMDCDLWIIVSDRLEHPLLPVRPYVLMVYDYVQRYESLLPQVINQHFIGAAHTAEQVFVTTEFTKQDVIQFAGLPSRKVCKLPMLAPEFSASCISAKDSVTCKQDSSPYFLWTTNLAPHKNHENALKALRIYYEQLDGQMECRVTGVDTKNMLKSNLPHLKSLRDIVAISSVLKRQLKLLGELPDLAYQNQLIGCAFLWHAGRIDNGTFSVVEAAHLGLPSLSSDYPAMREIDAQFGLNLSWMDAHSPNAMAQQLKMMESKAMIFREHLPSAERLATQSVEQLADSYWHAVRKCL
jgi:glycosyltransferase involved in cell wall biosynthesis